MLFNTVTNIGTSTSMTHKISTLLLLLIIIIIILLLYMINKVF